MSMRPLLLIVIGALSYAGAAEAAYIRFWHDYGEIVDRGTIRAVISSADSSARLCEVSAPVMQEGNEIVLTTRMWPRGQTPGSGQCLSGSSFTIGTLAAGTYEVTGYIESPDGVVVETKKQSLEVLPIEGRCNADPTQAFSIAGQPAGGVSAQEFIRKVSTDTSFAAAIGNPVMRIHSDTSGDFVHFSYPPLADIPPAMDRLERSGPWGQGGLVRLQSQNCSISSSRVDLVEFFNAQLDHYFYSGDAGEIAAIEAGKVGMGWARTGGGFTAYARPYCLVDSKLSAAYRFHGIPGVGPNSHFFTRDRAECYAVDRSEKWSLEGVPFWVGAVNADGHCDSEPASNITFVPLYRAWRPFGDSNHRFSTDRAVIDAMVAKGWVDEGMVMCAVAVSEGL